MGMEEDANALQMSRVLGIDLDIVGLFQHGDKAHIETLAAMGGRRMRSVGLEFEQARNFADHGLGRTDELGHLAWCHALFELEEDFVLRESC